MKASLDEIFGKILISEQEANCQKASLREVKNKISQAEACIKDLDDEISNLKVQMLFQIQKLSEKEVTAKSLQIRGEILLRRREKLRAEKKRSEKILADLDEELKNLMVDFCADASKFTSKFGFQKEFENYKKNEKQGVNQRVQLRLEYPQMVWDQKREPEMQDDVPILDEGEAWECNSNSDIVVSDAEFQRINEEFENCDVECFIDACNDPEF